MWIAVADICRIQESPQKANLIHQVCMYSIIDILYWPEWPIKHSDISEKHDKFEEIQELLGSLEI